MLGYYQSVVSATRVTTAQVEARTATYFLFVMAAISLPLIVGPYMDRLSRAGCLLSVQIIHVGLRSLQVRAVPKQHS